MKSISKSNLIKESDSGNLSETEDMEEDSVSVVESSLDSATCNEPAAKVAVNKNSSVETPKTKKKEIAPKPSMVLEIEDVICFTAKLEAGCEENFRAKFWGRWLKVIPNTFAAKAKIASYLKEQKFQFYVLPGSAQSCVQGITKKHHPR